MKNLGSRRNRPFTYRPSRVRPYWYLEDFFWSISVAWMVQSSKRQVSRNFQVFLWRTYHVGVAPWSRSFIPAVLENGKGLQRTRNL